MNKFIQSALLAVSVGFLGLMISTQVRSQVRLDAEEVTTIRLQSFFKMPIGPKGLDVSKKKSSEYFWSNDSIDGLHGSK